MASNASYFWSAPINFILNLRKFPPQICVTNDRFFFRLVSGWIKSFFHWLNLHKQNHNLTINFWVFVLMHRNRMHGKKVTFNWKAQRVFCSKVYSDITLSFSIMITLIFQARLEECGNFQLKFSLITFISVFVICGLQCISFQIESNDESFFF